MQTCRVCYGSNISFHPQFRQRPGLHRCQSQLEDRQSTKHSNLIMENNNIAFISAILQCYMS